MPAPQQPRPTTSRCFLEAPGDPEVSTFDRFNAPARAGSVGAPLRGCGQGLRGAPLPLRLSEQISGGFGVVRLGGRWKGSKNLNFTSSVVGFQPRFNHNKQKWKKCVPTTMQSSKCRAHPPNQAIFGSILEFLALKMMEAHPQKPAIVGSPK